MFRNPWGDKSATADPDDGPPTGDPSLAPKSTLGPIIPNPVTEAKAKLQKVDIIQYYLHVTCTKSNIIATICNEKHEPVQNGSWSGGSVGFKNKNESGYEAGYQCCIRAFKRMKELLEQLPAIRFEMRLSGAGQARDAFTRSIMTTEGDHVRDFINCVTDTTGIQIGGCRGKKARRL
ncbi:hypothetical protein K488DRAFT_41919 [Vararia minispora EC-137]|uniref:Uncharacterized protein n=1 Tax=Vararia minispora EC-137 TaxID=1314806 RepID=A0ACB8QWI5_9AGAM|nr:hypothetical protein K488DRAFT_41919 [Vararia minispora EC-137]